MGIAEVICHAKRKTLEMPVLWIVSDHQQGQESNQTDGNKKDTLLQGLQAQIHPEEPETRS